MSDKFGDGCAEGAVLPERDELDDEKPVVVVVNEGDLTESEAKVIEKRLETKGCEDSVDDNEDGEGNHRDHHRNQSLYQCFLLLQCVTLSSISATTVSFRQNAPFPFRFPDIQFP